MTTNIIILDIVLCFGIVSMATTLVLGLVFYRHRHINPLFGELALMAWGMTVMSLCTFMFGAAAWAGEYVNLPVWFMNLLRIIIFSSAIIPCMRINIMLRYLTGGK